MRADGLNLKGRIIAMEKRSCIHIIRCLFLFVVILLLMGWPPITSVQANPVSDAEENPMELAQKTESPTIPPIDAAAPSKFETASFGLG
jgi:hypothetical protein